MNFFTEEMYKGISDLPILLVAMSFSIFLRKFEEKKVWSQFFMLLAEAAFIGAAIHMLALEGGYKKVAWAVLYVLLYEVVRNLSLALSGYILKEEVQYPKLMWWVQVLMFLASFVLLLKEIKYDIYVFVGFAVLNLAWLIYIAISGSNQNVDDSFVQSSYKKLSAKLWAFFGLALIAAGLQALKEVVPYGVVWGHLVILIAMCVLFSISIED